MCRQCGLPYTTTSENIGATPEEPKVGEWVCRRCQDQDKAAVTTNLIAELKEKARVKALERE